jgi:2-polyprenyl-3-methyl-5-hydroxy-6-metoxy-1,4-benzoquinol methylase
MPVQKYTNKTYLKLYERLAQNHIQTFWPVFQKAFGSFRGKQILDVGCGDGQITNALARKGARVLGIDKSAKWIAHCKKTYQQGSITFQCLNATQIQKLQPRKFDVVLMNMVLVNVDTAKEIQKIFQGIRKVLKPNGVLVFSDLHPACVMAGPHPDRWFTFSPGFSYSKNGSQFKAHIRLNARHSISFLNRHWNLEFYSQCLAKNGMGISKIFEPFRAQGIPNAKKYRVPEFIVIVARLNQ